jgi:hypothetical protein
LVLVGRFLNLYLMIFPPLIGPSPALGVWAVGVSLGALALTALVLFRALGRPPSSPSAVPTSPRASTTINRPRRASGLDSPQVQTGGAMNRPSWGTSTEEPGFLFGRPPAPGRSRSETRPSRNLD